MAPSLQGPLEQPPYIGSVYRVSRDTYGPFVEGLGLQSLSNLNNLVSPPSSRRYGAYAGAARALLGYQVDPWLRPSPT